MKQGPKTRVVHLTSVHRRLDPRIFLKECISLARGGFDVDLVVADGLGNETRSGVGIHDTGASLSRLRRILFSTWSIYSLSRKLNAAIFHIHDPELIPVGLLLRHSGARVIFDSHEDVSKQMLSKPYLGPLRLKLLSAAYSRLERFACRRLDAVLAATPTIRDQFLTINPNTDDINNFPLLDELDHNVPWQDKRCEVCYVGTISRIRGITEVVEALDLVRSNLRLNLCGKFNEPLVESSVRELPGWSRVNSLGYLNRAEVRDVLCRSVAGIVTLHPTPNHIDAQPTKMFEYMAAGIPVVASRFPLWRDIVEGNHCGLCVDPFDPSAIAAALDYLVQNPKDAERMGRNGRKAILERYNWGIEEKKLLRMYRGLLAQPIS